tara:strand:- start:377 stop:487 length:111 start_codon:yes stop_codon:yes gene_type:complete
MAPNVVAVFFICVGLRFDEKLIVLAANIFDEVICGQ